MSEYRGYCPDCHGLRIKGRYAKEGANSTRGYGTPWKKLRAMVLHEEPLCRYCAQRGAYVIATDVDHIMPLKEGGTNSRDNLQPLCHECHSRKTIEETRKAGSI